MFGAFANTFRIPELRKRIFFTLGLVFICRVLSLVPTPGVDWRALSDVLRDIRESAAGAGGLMGMVDVFSGGAMHRCSIGFLGIWPYISAQIVLQMMTALVPALERMARDGESGRQRLNQWTRYFTICICVVQGFFIARMLENPSFLNLRAARPLVSAPGFGFELLTVIGMTTAAMFMMWLGDQITERGVGNGISLIIMINISSRLPNAIFDAWGRYFSAEGSGNYFELALLLLLGFLVCVGTVMLTQGVRKVPVHNAGRAVGSRAYGGQATYMPLRVNFSGVMPIIFAGPLLTIPGSLLQRIQVPESGAMRGVLRALRDFGSSLVSEETAAYIFLFSLLVLFFSFFWVATQFNAMRIADDLKRTGGYVPGIRPGQATAEFLDRTMSRVTLIGALGLIVIAILPSLLRVKLHLSWEIATFFGGTSLLIIVGVALDTLRQMESLLVMRHYDGFLKHGRIRSRAR